MPSILIQQNGKVWTFDQFKENIKKSGVEDIVIPIVKTSEEAAKDFIKPVELIFIDGAHEYEMVKKDLECWFPKVIEGGIIAFHDSAGWNRGGGPSRLVEESVYPSKQFKNVDVHWTITFGTKVSQNTSLERLENKISLLKKYIYDNLYHYIPEPIKAVIRNKIK